MRKIVQGQDLVSNFKVRFVVAKVFFKLLDAPPIAIGFKIYKSGVVSLPYYYNCIAPNFIVTLSNSKLINH